VVDYLNAQLPVTVERRALEGMNDRGDVAGVEGLVVEAKCHKSMSLGEWLTEAEREADKDGGSLPVVAHKRRGKGDVADNYFTLPGWAFVELLKAWLAMEVAA
jgi:hypothetical protein